MRHDGLAKLLREKRGVVEWLLRAAKVRLPPHDSVTQVEAELGEPQALELRADGVLRLDRGGRPTLALVLEVQLRADAKKRRSWPAYHANGCLQFGCEVWLVVLTTNVNVAKWARHSIRLGPHGTFTPLVLGPDEVPLLRNLRQAKRAVFAAAVSAAVHGHSEKALAMKNAKLAMKAVHSALKGDERSRYAHFIFASLPPQAREELSMFTEREFKENPFIRAVAKRAATLAREKAMEKGMEQGQAFSVLEVLKARRMKISEAQKKRILKTTDRKTLTRWLRLAATSDNAAALFRQ